MTGNRKIESGKRIVVKIGSALLADQENGAVHREWLAALAEDIAACIKRGQEVILVSSGAIPIGPRQLRRPPGPANLHRDQAGGPHRHGRLPPGATTLEHGTRDYYRIEDASGKRYWLYREGLYRDGAEPRWFLHGLFG